MTSGKSKNKASMSARMARKIARIKPLGESRMSRQGAMNGIGMLSLLGNMRSFNIADVVPMMEDDQVALGLDYLKIPIGHAPIAVKTSKPEAYAFTCDLYQRIWGKLTPKLDMYFGYGWTCLEPLYRKDPQNLLYWDFSDFDIAPSLGSVPWVYNDRLAFVAVDLSSASANFVPDLDNFEPDAILEGAGKFRPSKALWLCNDPLRSRWYGRSSFRAAHLRWKAKNMPDGMLESMFKAMYKASFSGLLIRYPAGMSVPTAEGQTVTSEEYADLLCQTVKNGSNIRFPSHIEEAPGWDIEQYAKNLVDMGKLQVPLDYVDRGILRGMGIPDDILNQGKAGGYSRSLVSIDAFYSRGETRAASILPSVTEYIVGPLVRQRYGEDCEVSAQILPAPRPDDENGGNGDQNGNGVPDALEGSMRQEQGPNGQGQGNQPPQQKQLPGPQSRFGIAMSGIEPIHEAIPFSEECKRRAEDSNNPDYIKLMYRMSELAKIEEGGSVEMSATAKADKDYSCAMFVLDAPGKSLIEKLTDMISKSDLAEKGIEDEPHITIKYGLHTNDADDVANVVSGFPGPVKVKLGKLSLFKHDDFDVLKIDVVSPALHRLNRRLCKLPHTDTFPDYKPHLTLAYVDAGQGDKYLDTNPLEGMELTFNTVAFRDKQRNSKAISLSEPEPVN